MSKVLVSCISPAGEALLNAYLNKFMPDAEIEPLKSFGIKGKMKTYAKRAEVALVIIDEIMYADCVGVADEVLSLPKVHKYVNDDGLKQFLISKFGRLDSMDKCEVDGVSCHNSDIALAVTDDMDNLAFGDELSHAHDTEDMLKDLKEELSQKQVIINNLELQLREANQNKNGDISYYLDKIKNLSEQLQAKDREFNALEASNHEMKDSVARADGYLSELNILKDSLRKEKENYSAIVYEKSKVDKELSNLKAELMEKSPSDDGSKDAEILGLQSKVAELNKGLEEVSVLRSTLNEKGLELNRLKEELQAEKESGVLLRKRYKTDIEDLESRLDTSDKELRSAQEALVGLADKDSEIESLRSQIGVYESTISTLRGDLSDATQVGTEREEKIKKLESELSTYISTTSDLQSDLSALRLDNEKLNLDLESKQSENSTLLKKIEGLETDMESVSILRERVSELESLLSEKEDSLSDELTLVKQELQAMTEKCQELKIDIIQRDEQLADLGKSIFTQMSGVVTPKAEFSYRLDQPIDLDSRFICVSCGSSGSLVDLYQLLFKSCSASACNKKVLILDLVTDSSIDKFFGIKQVISPIDWLMGGKSFESFLASTKLSNVKVLSVALSYINDLYLLHVDWGKRLEELKGCFDVVLINIGCLLNVTAKVLFNTFNKRMRSYIVVKATPINLRTVYLNTMGLRLSNNENVEVCCTNFDTASNIVYEKLRQKLKAVVYMDSDILVL